MTPIASTQLSLADLESPEPDWDLVLVTSDFYEDQGDLPTAQALRWLNALDHWPFQLDTGIPLSYIWWANSPVVHRDRLNLVYCRYGERQPLNYPSGQHAERFIRASLPSCFYTSCVSKAAPFLPALLLFINAHASLPPSALDPTAIRSQITSPKGYDLAPTFLLAARPGAD